MGATGPSVASYRFRDLGWMQFQRVCDLVLEQHAGMDPHGWIGDADDIRHVAAPEGVTLSQAGIALEGPALVAVRWLSRRRSPPPTPLRELVRWARPSRRARFASLLMIANRPPDESLPLAHAAARDAHLPPERVAALGPAELGPLIDTTPEVRLAMPSLLGVRASLDGLIASELRERSTLA